MSGLFLGASTVWAAPFSVLGYRDFPSSGGSNPVGAEMDVDPVNNYVYLSSGMGYPYGFYRFDVSNPETSIGLNTTLNPGWGSGIGVNPTTGTYATTNGYSGQVRIFDPMMAPLDTESLTG